MPSDDNTNSKTSVFTISVLLFIIPAYVYLCSYQYERGICKYYGLPVDLIRLDLTTSLFYSISVFAAFSITYYLPHTIFLIVHDKVLRNPEFFPFLRLNTLVLVFFSAGVYLAAYEIAWIDTLFMFILAALIINGLALMQYLYIKDELKTRSYDVIANAWNTEVSSGKFPILDFPDIFNLRSFFYQMSTQSRNLIFIMIALVYTSFHIGKATAYRKTTYEISTKRNNYILLKAYGDNLIMKKCDFKTNKLLDSTILIKLGPTIDQPFVSRNIGRLHPNSN